MARSSDPTTWACYEEACAAYEQKPASYQGLGYMFCGEMTGVALDHCVHPDGRIDLWARRVLDQLASYAEFSPGDGIHILLRGAISTGLRKRVSSAPHAEATVEMYCRGRYFTITGRHVPGTPDQLAVACDESLLLVEAAAAKSGETFRALWQGDTRGYLSASAADLALCNLLACWTGNDPIRVDRLFRFSGLYQAEQWDLVTRSGETYGAETVACACSQQSTTRQGSGTQRASRSKRGTDQTRRMAIPFPVREGESSVLPEMQQYPLPATPIDLVLECLQQGETGDARLFTHLFRRRFVYDHTGKQWYFWQGYAWKCDETGQVINMVSGPLAAVYLDASAALTEQEANEARALPPGRSMHRSEEDEEIAQARRHLAWLRSTTAALIERARALRSRHRIQNVLTLACVQEPLSITSDQWDTHPWLLATPQGVIDLQTGQAHPGRPEDYIRTALSTSWQGLQAPAPRFERFWQEIFADRPDEVRAELIAFMQRALGYGITGHVKEHIFLMLFGEEGRNGKDTLMEALQHVLGPVSGAVSNDVLIASGRSASPGSAKSHLCSLQGKRVTWASETSKGACFDARQVKYLTGGGTIVARQLYGRDYTFAPSHLLLLLTNQKPQADAGDTAFWNRLCPILFNMRFVDRPQAANECKRDADLLQELRSEASGILAWLVRGCLDWQRRGLSIPESVLQAQQAYRGEEDTFQGFLQECCVLNPQAKVRAGQMYHRYKIWAGENNLRVLNGQAFGREMKKRFVYNKDRRGIYYQGIGILAIYEAGSVVGSEREGCEGSLHCWEPAQQEERGQKQEEVCAGSAGTCKNFSHLQNRSLVREGSGSPLHSLHTAGDLNPAQPARQAAEGRFAEGEEILHTVGGEEPISSAQSNIALSECEGCEGFLHCWEPAQQEERGQEQEEVCAGTCKNFSHLQNRSLVKESSGSPLHSLHTAGGSNPAQPARQTAEGRFAEEEATLHTAGGSNPAQPARQAAEGRFAEEEATLHTAGGSNLAQPARQTAEDCFAEGAEPIASTQQDLPLPAERKSVCTPSASWVFSVIMIVMVVRMPGPCSTDEEATGPHSHCND
jgi:putative DNA primase/helicase